MPDLTPKAGALLWITEEERRLLAALRADPLQHEHVVVFRDEGSWTMQHPIEERANGSLFDCTIEAAMWQYDELEDDQRYVVTQRSDQSLDFRWVEA